MIRAPLTCALAAVLTLALVPACGKKGPPLPPLSNRPRAPEAVTARLQGDRVVVRFTIPRANQSGVQPANIERVEVYALTGPKLVAARLLEHAGLVATVPVRRPAPPEGETPLTTDTADPAALDQGAPAVVMEVLTAQAFQPVIVDDKSSKPRVPPRTESSVVVRRTPLVPPDLGTPVEPTPVRYYVAVGVNRGGRRGTPSAVVAVPLRTPPAAPSPPAVEVRERSVELRWERPAGPAAAPTPEGVLPSRRLTDGPQLTRGYNVYVVPPPDVARAPASPFAVSALAELLNPRPLSEPSYSDTRAEFGTERCYMVRSVETAGSAVVEGAPSPVRCVKVVDVFPPAAPTALAAIAGERSVNLIWEPNREADLAGYVVFRSDRAEGPLEPLVTDPVRETTWRDTNVTSGVRYRYGVAAVDRATPPNRSELSKEVEVTPR